MEIHNITEDIVFTKVAEIFSAIEKGENKEDLCTCSQCRMDTTCYVLNRTKPRYIISNRGVARAEQDTIERQQLEADMASLVYEGLKRINHNLRPNSQHGPRMGSLSANKNTPAFNLPTIVGRLFDGANFAPLSGIQVALCQNGEMVVMKNDNWQNPYVIVDKTEGTFTFGPISIPTEAVDTRKIFEFYIHVEAPGFEPLHHHFQIAVTSEMETAESFSMSRTFKLPDLYMFPPGGEEDF